MAVKVSNLKIQLQNDSDTYFASWTFEENKNVPGSSTGSGSTSSGSIKVGDYVKVKTGVGAKWYNGVGIASFVYGDEWKVIEIRGNRVVIDRNRSGTNRIESPIHVKYLTKVSSKSVSTTATTRATSVVATLDHFNVMWFYDTGNGWWFRSSETSSETTAHTATYNAPANATRIKVQVRPVSKKRKVNNKETSYWTGSTVSVTYSVSKNPPEVPPSPTVEIEKYELTATINNITDPRTDKIQFQIYDMTELFNTGKVDVGAALASYKCNVKAGGSYRVRARSINLTGGTKYSDWTDFTNTTDTIPAAPTGITTIRGSSSTSVYLEWDAVNSAETYDIEYTDKVKYFDTSSETKKVTGVEFNRYEVTGLETGSEYFFRVRAVNDKGASNWTEPKSVVIGKKPAAPTTWSSATTVIVGDELNLYWVHNAEDNSTERYAEVEITIGDNTQVYTVENELADDEENPDKDKTKHYTVDTSVYTEGTKIKWRVRTAGVTLQYGDWSVQRSVDIYAPPTLELSLTDQNGNMVSTLTSFPLFVKGVPGPQTQAPIGYHVTVVANEAYDTVNNIGQDVSINAGDEVYDRQIDTSDVLLIELDPGNIDLENDISYTVTVIASMNSGLTVMESADFNVSWTDVTYELDAEIAVDDISYTAYITPFARDEDGEPIPNLSLGVYRREFDGTFKEIQTGLDSTMNTLVTDPHPALDYARYRIIAVDNATGAVSHYDAPAYPVNCPYIIIQWDEEWTSFATLNEDELADPLWKGSMLTLPYNIEVSNDTSIDSSLVEYMGREYPVSYYGTQKGTTASWSTAIPATDQETIYALRRLAIYAGDVYVREPYGTGYWANISVSFSQKYSDLTVPVSLSLTRVDGGI